MTGVPPTALSAAVRLRTSARRLARAARRGVIPAAVLAAAVPMAASMTLQPVAAQAAAGHAPVPAAQKPVPVYVVHGTKAKIPVMTEWKRPVTSWPAAGSATVGLAAA